jgi:dienelactone hydrolase
VAPSRTLAVTVAYPAVGGPFPLVLFAHGFRLGPPGYQHLIDTVASAGYVVAAPSFPLADEAVAGAEVDRSDIPRQSGDLRFVADHLPADLPVDRDRIGAVGHSDGADTVLDLGYHRDLRDPRVLAVAAIAPDPVILPEAAGPPLLLAHGTADEVVPHGASAIVLGRVPVRRWLLSLIGAGHLPPVQGVAPWAGPLERAVLALLDFEVAGRTGEDVVAAAVPDVAEVQPAG